MSDFEKLFNRFCSAQASFESSRHIYRREHEPGQVRRFFNTSFTAFELRRYIMNFYSFIKIFKRRLVPNSIT